jgi:uroporphyrinogen decarboxylase
MMQRFDIDIRFLHVGTPYKTPPKWIADNCFIDEWGGTWEKPEGSLYWDPTNTYPLADASIDDLETYPWPDPDDPGRYAGLGEKAKYLFENTDFALFIDNPMLGVFEISWMVLRGPNFFSDMITDPEFCHRLLEKATDFQARLYHNLVAACGNRVECIVMSDDLGTQQNAFISPETYRKFILPCHRRQVEAIKQVGDVKISLHSCGNVYALIPDLIEAGIEVLNPIQVSAGKMGDTARLKSDFGDKMVFWGGVCSQQVLPHGTIAEVEAEVKRRLHDLAPGGGYIFAPSHNIQADVPPENTIAMYDAAKKFASVDKLQD